MKTIQNVAFAPGEYTFKKSTKDSKGQRKEAHYLFNFTLHGRSAKECQGPLTELQKEGSIVTMKSDKHNFQGNCRVHTFSMVPNKVSGEPSYMKGQLNIYGTPDILKSFSTFMVDADSEDLKEVDVSITAFQSSLPLKGEKE